MQLANFSNTSIIDQKSIDTSTYKMLSPHDNEDHKQYSPRAHKEDKPNSRKKLLDSIVTLKSSYITFHSKMLQRSQSYEELSSNSQIQAAKKEKSDSNGNINVEKIIAETRSQNERSEQVKGSMKDKEGQEEEMEEMTEEKQKEMSEQVEKGVSVLIQNSGLIKKEISVINQDETLKHFIEELNFSRKEESLSNIDEIEVIEIQKKSQKSQVSLKKNSLKSSAKDDSRNSSRESIKSLKSADQSSLKRSQRKGGSNAKTYSAIIITLSIGLNVLFFMLSMTQNIKLPGVLTTLMEKKASPIDKIIFPQESLLKQQPIEQIDNSQTVPQIEVLKNVTEYEEYQELKAEKEKLENENRFLKFKLQHIEQKEKELWKNFTALNGTFTKMQERVKSVTERLDQRLKIMEKLKEPQDEFAVKNKEFLALVKAMLLG